MDDTNCAASAIESGGGGGGAAAAPPLLSLSTDSPPPGMGGGGGGNEASHRVLFASNGLFHLICSCVFDWEVPIVSFFFWLSSCTQTLPHR